MASIVDRIIDCGVVAVLRADNPSQLMDVSKALREGGVVAIEGTGTEARGRRILRGGAMKGVHSTTDLGNQGLVAKAQARPSRIGIPIRKAFALRRIFCGASMWGSLNGAWMLNVVSGRSAMASVSSP